MLPLGVRQEFTKDAADTLGYENGILPDDYEVIKDYDDSICYGYCGREDCAMFRDFKDVVRDCIENNCEMTWY